MGIDSRTLPPHLRKRLGVSSPQNRAAPVTAEAWADAQRRAAATRRTRNAAGAPTHPAVSPPDDFAPTVCVGLDPSVAEFGWAVVNRPPGDLPDEVLASGTWRPRTNHNRHGDRLKQMWGFLTCLLQDKVAARWHETLVAIELPGGSSTYAMRGMSAHTHGRACGVAYAVCLASGLRVVTPGVREWKGQASKRATHDQVRLRTGHEPAGDDEADAVGLALWGLDGGWRAKS